MKEYPILFSGEMVRAILEGRKTQTRRVIKPQPIMMDSGTWYPSDVPGDGKNKTGLHYANENHMRKGLPFDFCPYGQPGDRLWVRETAKLRTITATSWKVSSFDLYYKADDGLVIFNNRAGRYAPYKRIGFTPSIHMPRWASRITLEVVNIRVERVQDITYEDAVAEGIPGAGIVLGNITMLLTQTNNMEDAEKVLRLDMFSELWDKINLKRGYGWEVNPWVWVIEFKREEQK